MRTILTILLLSITLCSYSQDLLLFGHTYTEITELLTDTSLHYAYTPHSLSKSKDGKTFMLCISTTDDGTKLHYGFDTEGKCMWMMYTFPLFMLPDVLRQFNDKNFFIKTQDMVYVDVPGKYHYKLDTTKEEVFTLEITPL